MTEALIRLADDLAVAEPPPLFNLDAEHSVLGCILYDNDCLDDVAGRLQPESFWEPVHQRVFEKASDLIRQGRRVDPTTLIEHFREDPALQRLGGVRYFADLVDHANGWALRPHAEVIADLATKRALVALADEVKQTVADPERDGQAMIAEMEGSLANLADVGADDEWLEAGACVAGAIDRAKERNGAIRYTWGIAELDELTGGLNAGESVIIAGRPGSMKTGVGIQIALANARMGLGTCLVSLEMSGDPMGLRMACAVAHDRTAPRYSAMPDADPNPWYLSASKGKLTDAQWARLAAAQAEIAALPLKLDVRAGRSISQIESAVRRSHRRWKKHGVQPGPVVVDHLGIVRPEKSRQGSKHAEVADVSRGLAEMAKRLGVPVVALCQLNRGVEGRDDKRPVMSDLRQAGEIEEDARAVVMIYRPAYYLRPPLDPSTEGAAEAAEREAKLARVRNQLLLLVEKNSHGPTGQVEAWCDPRTSAVGDRLMGGAHG